MTNCQITIEEGMLDIALSFITEGIENRIEDLRGGMIDDAQDRLTTEGEVRFGFEAMIALTKGTNRHEGICHQIDTIRDTYFPEW